MKLSALLLASANACFYQEPAGPENFIMSGRVEWEMLMDSVMGGLSTGSLIHSLLPKFLTCLLPSQFGEHGRVSEMDRPVELGKQRRFRTILRQRWTQVDRV